MSAPAAVEPVVAAVVPPIVEPPAKSGLDMLRETVINPPAPEKKAEVVEAKKEVVPPKEVKVPATPGKTEPEVKAPAKPADEVDEFLNGVTPKSKDRFNELSAKKAEALYQERLKTLKLLTPETEEKLTASERRAADLEVELRQVAIERSPEYKQKFIERPKEIRAKLTELAKINEIPEGELLAAIDGGTASRRQLNTLLSSVGAMDQADMTELAREFQKIQEDRTKVTSDHETALKLLHQKRLDDTKSAIQNLMSRRTEALEKAILPQFEKEYAPVFEGEKGAALREKALASIRYVNGCDLEAMEPAHRAKMISYAVMADSLMEELTARNARIAELEAKLSAEDMATPKVGGRSTGAPAEEKPKSFAERMREELAGANK